MANSEDGSKQTSAKFTRYHAFYRSVAGLVKERLPDADIAQMSKTASCMWKKCSLHVQQDWKKKGQLMREDIDCGIISYNCKKCNKQFARAKDAKYHEKHCGECICGECAKTFIDKIALKSSTRAVHVEGHKCKVCKKLFSAHSSLKRHSIIHDGVKSNFTCKSCNRSFTK